MNATTDTTDSKPARSKFVKTNIPNLVKLVPSETYYSRCKVGGKLVRESLKTTVFAVAKKKLPLWLIGARGRTSNSDMAMGVVIDDNPRGRLFKVQSIKRVLRSACLAVGTPVLTHHDLRHSLARGWTLAAQVTEHFPEESCP